MARPERVRLGDLLVNAKLISQQQLEQALAQQKASGRRLGRVLVDNAFINEEKISEALAKQFRIPYIDLKNYNLNPDLVRRLPEEQARRYRSIVLEINDGVLRIGMADPTDLAGFDDIARTLKCDLDVVVVTEGQVLESIDRGYRRTDEIGGQMYGRVENIVETQSGPSDQPVITQTITIGKLIDDLFDTAMRMRASDIHIEKNAQDLSYRFRVDGVLYAHIDTHYPPSDAMVVRLKMMAELDIAEKFAPQAGRFHTRVAEQGIMVYLASCPVGGGESIVMHLVYQDRQRTALDSLGMPDAMLMRLREIIECGKGMVLFSGPGSSGKTTSLHATLAEIDKVSKKVMSVETRVEYELAGVQQIRVDAATGLSFAAALQAAEQQDPDVLMLSELHEQDAARLAVKAAMDERVVLASLNSNDAISALFHVADLGVPRFMLACSLQAVVAQRLLRRVCGHCGEPYVATSQESAWLKSMGVTAQTLGSLRHGRGCVQCHSSGYHGRIAVFEMLEMTRALVDAAALDSPGSYLQEANKQLRGKTLIEQGLALVKQGQTTLSEVMRMSNQHRL